ncbi:MAG: uracil phosphoribosyltransferase [Acholeplasmataceae bacterium]
MSKTVIIKHPLIDHKMAIIRQKTTNMKKFRENVSELGALITYEITKDLETVPIEIETPITKTVAYELKKQIVLVPILRAGLGMVDGIHNLIPTAKIGHIGLYRDEKTALPVSYYKKLPSDLENSCVIVLDPMLATGGSASDAITEIKKDGATDVRFVGLVGCPEGVLKLQTDHPDVPIYLAALDEKLDENKYIVPGLGDCGDRLFGTK